MTGFYRIDRIPSVWRDRKTIAIKGQPNSFKRFSKQNAHLFTANAKGVDGTILALSPEAVSLEVVLCTHAEGAIQVNNGRTEHGDAQTKTLFDGIDRLGV